MVVLYVFGLRPFLVNNLYINITLFRVVTRFWFIRKPSHWNEVISCVRTAVVALSEPAANTKLVYAMRYTRALK